MKNRERNERIEIRLTEEEMSALHKILDKMLREF